MIPNAWHFSFHREFSVYGGMVGFRGRVTHTLMRRYALGGSFVSQGKRESFK